MAGNTLGMEELKLLVIGQKIPWWFRVVNFLGIDYSFNNKDYTANF